MKKKNTFIFFGTILILLLLLIVVYTLIPTMSINVHGKKYLTLSIGEIYKEQGADAYIQSIKGKKKISVKTSGNVNDKKIGKYIVRYYVDSKYGKKEAIRIVNVIDSEKPVIELQNDIYLCKKNKLVEIKAKAKDNYDGDISSEIKYNVLNDKIHLTVTDSSNNKTEIFKKLTYIDNEKPIITLNGDSDIYILKDTNYEELGATAYDSCDGDISDKINIISNVDVTKEGEYVVSYQVKDSIGIESVVNRKIFVIDEKEVIEEAKVKNKATIYLTFDDGPHKYTEEILNILKKYDIKATFFVTGQFPKYLHLIKKEYELGHTIGIHTYSHKWSIYSSAESYIEDFDKMKQIIFEQTGNDSMIFRFPGGSSNTISKNYNKGVVTELARTMTDKGYCYFDWNVDSGDTAKKNTPDSIYNHVKSSLKGDGDYIILMHDIKENTVKALPKIIEFALYHGYDFAPLTVDSPKIQLKIAN